MGKGYDKEKWRKRIKDRSDITGHVTHLTRFSNTQGNKLENLIKILKDRKLNGSSSSNGFVNGRNSAVCFQEAPIYGVSQNVYHEQQNRTEFRSKVRYDAIGLSFPKKYVFEKGGRPVFYENTAVAKEILPPEEWYRIVNFDLNNDEKIIDWTHEREWRIKGDFEFDLSEVYVLLLNEGHYKNFVKEIDKEILEEIKGIVVLQPILE